MHELGLARGVVAAVEAEAARRGATGVEAVGVRVGELSGVVADALLGVWPLAVARTPLAEARLDIEEVPAAVWCPACAAEQPVDQFFALTCPVCATPTANLIRGREFEIAYADMDVPPAP